MKLPDILQGGRYVAAGIALNLSAIVSFATLFNLFGGFAHYLVLHLINSVFWTLISFFVHAKFSFQTKKTTWKANYRNLIRFFAASVLNYFATASTMLLLVELADLRPEIARVLAALVLLPGVFVLNKSWVYLQRS